MKSAFRLYRLPIIVALLMIAGLTFWAVQAYRDILAREKEMQRQFTMGAAESITGTLQALERDGNLDVEQAQQVLESIVRQRPLRFIVLEQAGRRLIEVGDVPKNLVTESAAGEMDLEGAFVYWSELHGQNEGRTLILGSEFSRNRGRIPPPLRSVLVTVSVAFLFVAASLVAWMMGIRSHLLAEQLINERARRAHLEELGLTAAGLAHETKNPLGIISGITERVLADQRTPEESRAMLEHVLDEVDKATARLGDFIAFARPNKARIKSVDARTVFPKVEAVLRPDFDEAGVALEVDCPTLSIHADREMLEQILVNLLLNSLHASSAGGRVTVHLQRHGSAAVLKVEDHGEGIPENLLPNIFKPYVVGNPSGHGLGLAIVKRFVEEHGWNIQVVSRIGEGTAVTISGIEVSGSQEDLQ